MAPESGTRPTGVTHFQRWDAQVELTRAIGPGYHIFAPFGALEQIGELMLLPLKRFSIFRSTMVTALQRRCYDS